MLRLWQTHLRNGAKNTSDPFGVPALLDAPVKSQRPGVRGKTCVGLGERGALISKHGVVIYYFKTTYFAARSPYQV